MLAKMDKENGVTDAAAICSTIAANMYGLDILQEDIQNNNQNRTRFAALSKEMIIPKNAEKISLCFFLASYNRLLIQRSGTFCNDRFKPDQNRVTSPEKKEITENLNIIFIWILPEMYIIAIHWTYFVPYPKNFPISPF